jgi:hypothetical protein
MYDGNRRDEDGSVTRGLKLSNPQQFGDLTELRLRLDISLCVPKVTASVLGSYRFTFNGNEIDI